MQCAYHPDREPVGACVECGRLICIECKTTLRGKYYCQACADKVFVHRSEEAAKPPAAAPAAATGAASHAPAAPPAATAPPAAAAPPVQQPISITVNTGPTAAPGTDAAIVNNSGQGSTAAFPEQLGGWSWGAFTFSWIWGIFNSTWIAFLSFIPVLNVVWCFVLGAKGKQWAWQNKKWESVESFRKTQNTWNKWGKALFIISIVLFVLYVVVMAILIATGYAEFE